MPGFTANNVAANYLSGRRNAQDEAYGNVRNVLGQQAIQQNQNEFADRAAGQQAGQQKATAERLLLAAQYGLQNPQPKAFIEQNFPEIAQAAGDAWRLKNDEQIRQELQNVIGRMGPQAGIAPAPKPVSYNTAPGPRGSVIQTNDTTGEQKQVIGPDNSQPVPAGSGNKYRPLTPQEVEAYGLPKGTTAQIDTNGKIDLINKPNAASVGRPLPPAIVKGLVENNSSIRKIDAALSALESYPDAFGAWNYLGDTVRQRSDKKGVDPRAKVADIGSMLIHDRSGAAVSASEFPRLAPFIPQATDDPATVKTKLENLKANIQMMQEETQQTFSPDQGYKPFNSAPGGAPPPSANSGWSITPAP